MALDILSTPSCLVTRSHSGPPCTGTLLKAHTCFSVTVSLWRISISFAVCSMLT
jgi:hypothetical protein